MVDADRDIRKVLFGKGRVKQARSTGTRPDKMDLQRTVNRATLEAEVVVNMSAVGKEMHIARMSDLKKLMEDVERDKWLYDARDM